MTSQLTEAENKQRKTVLLVDFVTALNATEDEIRGLEIGAADYISKPVRPVIVLTRVRCQLELKMRETAWLTKMPGSKQRSSAA